MRKASDQVIEKIESHILCSRQFFFENRAVYEIKSKGLLQQAEVVQGVPGRLRPRIFLTFGSTRVVGRQP